MLFISAWSRKQRKHFFHKEKWGRFSFLVEFIQVFITFNLVNFVWIFFRAESIQKAIFIFERMLVFEDFDITLEPIPLFLAVIQILILLVAEQIPKYVNISQWFIKKPIVIRWGIYLITIYIILFFGNVDEVNFIYAQF